MGLFDLITCHTDRKNNRVFHAGVMLNKRWKEQSQTQARSSRDAALAELEQGFAAVPSLASHINNLQQLPAELQALRAAYAACLYGQDPDALVKLPLVANTPLVEQFLQDNPLSLALMHGAYDSVHLLLEVFPQPWDPLDRSSFHGVSIHDALQHVPSSLAQRVRGHIKASAFQAKVKGLAATHLADRYNDRPQWLNGEAIQTAYLQGTLLARCFDYLIAHREGLQMNGMFYPLLECALLEDLLHVEARQLDPTVEGESVRDYLPYLLECEQAQTATRLFNQFQPILNSLRLRGPFRPEMLAYYQALGPAYEATVTFLQATNAEWATGFAQGFHQPTHFRASHHPVLAQRFPDYVPADWEVQCRRPWDEAQQVLDKAQYTQSIQAWWLDLQKAQVNQAFELHLKGEQYQAALQQAYQAQVDQRLEAANRHREALEAHYQHQLAVIEQQYQAQSRALDQQLNENNRAFDRATLATFTSLSLAIVAAPLSQGLGLSAGSLGAQAVRIGLNLTSSALIHHTTQDLDKQLLAAVLSAGLQTYCLGAPSASWTLTDYYSAQVIALGPQLIVLEQDLDSKRLTQLLLSGGLDSLGQQFIEAHPDAPVLGPALSQAVTSTVSQAVVHKGTSKLGYHFLETLGEASLNLGVQAAESRKRAIEQGQARAADGEALDALISSLLDDGKPSPPKASSWTSAPAVSHSKKLASLSSPVSSPSGITAATLFDRDLDSDPLGIRTYADLPSTTHKPQLEYFSEHKMLPARVRQLQDRTPSARQTNHERSDFHQASSDTLDPRFYRLAQRLHVEDQIARGAFHSHLPEPTLLYKLCAQLPLLSFEQLNFTVGLGDRLSFGMGASVRNLTSLKAEVDTQSPAYQRGQNLGSAVNLTLAGAWVGGISMPRTLGQMSVTELSVLVTVTCSSSNQVREPFQLPPVLPAHHDNPYLNTAFALGRGIEKGRDATANMVLHPIEMLGNLGQLLLDAAGELVNVGISPAFLSARARNEKRLHAIKEVVQDFKAGDVASKVEISTTFLSQALLTHSLQKVGLAGVKQGLEASAAKLANRLHQPSTSYAQETQFVPSSLNGPNSHAQAVTSLKPEFAELPAPSSRPSSSSTAVATHYPATFQVARPSSSVKAAHVTTNNLPATQTNTFLAKPLASQGSINSGLVSSGLLFSRAQPPHRPANKFALKSTGTIGGNSTQLMESSASTNSSAQRLSQTRTGTGPLEGRMNTLLEQWEGTHSRNPLARTSTANLHPATRPVNSFNEQPLSSSYSSSTSTSASGLRSHASGMTRELNFDEHLSLTSRASELEKKFRQANWSDVLEHKPTNLSTLQTSETNTSSSNALVMMNQLKNMNTRASVKGFSNKAPGAHNTMRITGARQFTGDEGTEAHDQWAEETYQEIRSWDAEESIIRIAANTNIPETIIRDVRQHIFFDERFLFKFELEIDDLNVYFGKFDADIEIAELWIKAYENNLNNEEKLNFERILAHEYVECGLMKIGIPYRYLEAVIYDPKKQAWELGLVEGFMGAHERAPNAAYDRPAWEHLQKQRKPSETLRFVDRNVEPTLTRGGKYESN